MTRKIQGVVAGVARSGVRTAQESALSVGRVAWLAGLGLVATAGETGVATFEALVAKGRRRRESPAEKVQRALAESGAEVVQLAEDSVLIAVRQASGFLARLGVPSATEIRKLKSRVDQSLRTLRAELG